MAARYLTIEAKHRRSAGFLASLADFSVTDGDAVSPDVVRDNPQLSLYCLDDATRQAIFVELPPEVDLAQAPFVYQTQYEQAKRLVAVPYETLLRLAGDLPAADHLIMIYMTGRCGSTLLSRVMNELDGVLSLSEPDVATQFVHLRNADGARDAELRDLLDAVVRVLFKPAARRTPVTRVLKLRGEGTQVMDLYQATFAQVKNLFLYRDAIGWVSSFYRIFMRGGATEYAPLAEVLSEFEQQFNYDFTQLSSYLDPGTTELSMPQLLTLWWLATMEWYLAKYARGFPIMAVRYSDLNTYREAVISAIFSYCGLPARKAYPTLAAFATDSQAGTFLARETPGEGNKIRLREEQRVQISRILARHPIINTPDFVAPATLRL